MKKLFWISLMSIVFFLSSCSDDECPDALNPDCDNYDPCFEKSPVTASFKMYEYEIGLDNWLEDFEIQQAPITDDTATKTTIIFEAPEGFTKYTWTIGAETIHERTFSRSHFPKGENVSIQLIVEGKTHFCFPKDDGIDTLVRTLFFTDMTISDSEVQYIYLATGIFQGAYVNTPLDTFTISIRQFRFNDYFQYYEYKPYIYNLPPNVCDVLICDRSSPSTRNQMAFLTQGGTDVDKCGRPGGIATVTQDSIDIRYIDLLDNRKFYHFRGKRIK